MTETGWLVVALLFGALAAAFYVKRELWIHRRRRRKRAEKR